ARMTVAAEQALLADHFDRPETADRARLLERAQVYVKRSFIRPEALAALNERVDEAPKVATV
ncbi:MAG: hypothetical protein H5U40_17030, partial [Polyangiaceae bacterium]|nr:hypothetical protein [Polyangiaceae bacterium]